MKKPDLNQENADLKKEVKKLKRLLQDAMAIIYKMKDFIDRHGDSPEEQPLKPVKVRKSTKKKTPKAAKTKKSKRAFS
jgi:hypothetical protein